MKYLLTFIACRDNGRVYVGQSIHPQHRFRQHARHPPLLMRKDAQNFYHFLDHFEMTIVYNTARKYLANRKEKQLIKKYQSEAGRSYNIMRGRPSSDPLYWIIRRGRSHNKFFFS